MKMSTETLFHVSGRGRRLYCAGLYIDDFYDHESILESTEHNKFKTLSTPTDVNKHTHDLCSTHAQERHAMLHMNLNERRLKEINL